VCIAISVRVADYVIVADYANIAASAIVVVLTVADFGIIDSARIGELAKIDDFAIVVVQMVTDFGIIESKHDPLYPAILMSNCLIKHKLNSNEGMSHQSMYGVTINPNSFDIVNFSCKLIKKCDAIVQTFYLICQFATNNIGLMDDENRMFKVPLHHVENRIISYTHTYRHCNP